MSRPARDRAALAWLPLAAAVLFSSIVTAVLLRVLEPHPHTVAACALAAVLLPLAVRLAWVGSAPPSWPVLLLVAAPYLAALLYLLPFSATVPALVAVAALWYALRGFR